MSDCRTITHTFYSPIYPLDEGNEDVGLIYFDVNKASSLGQKNQDVSREYDVYCIGCSHQAGGD